MSLSVSGCVPSPVPASLVILTGASRGLGLALAGALAAAGYPLAVCSRTCSPELAALVTASKGRLWFQEADLAAPEADTGSVRRFLAAAVAWGASLEIPAYPYALINNAAIAAEGVLATFPEAAIEAVLRTNLHGPIQASRAFLRHFLSCRPGPEPGLRPSGGRILTISSIVARRGYSGLAVYAASKAGLEGLTRALAREVGRRGVTVNALAPGFLATDLSASLDGSQRQQIVRRTPLGRLGTPADVVPAALFLLSEGAAFLTGQVLTLDGGLTC